MSLLDSDKNGPDVDWPFEDAPNTVAFTNQHVLDGKLVTAVYHDGDDGAWQFHTDDPDTNSNTGIRLVCLDCVYKLDPTIGQLASLPLGHMATRSSRDSQWVIEKNPRWDGDNVD